MTLAKARAILKPPLVFGNAEQIKAVRFMEQVEECKERILACENVDEHIVCKWIYARNCDCNYKFDDEIVKGALSTIKYERRNQIAL